MVFCAYVFAMADNSVFPDSEPALRPRASEMAPPMVGGGVLSPLFIRYAANARPTTTAVIIVPIHRVRMTPFERPSSGPPPPPTEPEPDPVGLSLCRGRFVPLPIAFRRRCWRVRGDPEDEGESAACERLVEDDADVYHPGFLLASLEARGSWTDRLEVADIVTVFFSL